MTPKKIVTIKVMTYNVLANAHLKPEWCPLADPKHLKKTSRYPRVTHRIIDLNADVLCLQEVDDELFKRLKRDLEPLDYRGLHTKYAGKPDGLATFLRWPLWKTPKFTTLRFNDARTNAGKATGRIAHIVRVGTEAGILTVANTHLKWDAPNAPEDARVGLAQARELLKKLSTRPEPRIVFGDFNAMPDDAILEAFRIAGYVDAHEVETTTFNSATGGARKIDYILHSQGFIAEALPTSEVTDTTPLPSESEPSDHVPLVARLTFAS